MNLASLMTFLLDPPLSCKSLTLNLLVYGNVKNISEMTAFHFLELTSI